MDPKVQYTLAEKQKGREYDAIRRDLRARGCEEDEIGKIIREADDLFLDSLLEEKEEPLFKLNYKLTGYGLIILGSGVTFLTYTGIIDLGNIYLIFYGPVISGIGMIGYDARKGIKEKRKKFRSPFSKWKD